MEVLNVIKSNNNFGVDYGESRLYEMYVFYFLEISNYSKDEIEVYEVL